MPFPTKLGSGTTPLPSDYGLGLYLPHRVNGWVTVPFQIRGWNGRSPSNLRAKSVRIRAQEPYLGRAAGVCVGHVLGALLYLQLHLQLPL